MKTNYDTDEEKKEREPTRKRRLRDIPGLLLKRTLWRRKHPRAAKLRPFGPLRHPEVGRRPGGGLPPVSAPATSGSGLGQAPGLGDPCPPGASPNYTEDTGVGYLTTAPALALPSATALDLPANSQGVSNGSSSLASNPTGLLSISSPASSTPEPQGANADTAASGSAGEGEPTTDLAGALADAQGDGAESGQGLGPAATQDGLSSSDGSPNNSQSAGPLGATSSGSPSANIGTNGAVSAGLTVHASSSATVPSVGGVLLHKPALAEFEIKEIALAGSELILIARDRQNVGASRFTLGQTITDAIFVAARRQLLGDSIWLSIDPPSHYREDLRRGHLPPDGTPMTVSYGGCRGTVMGKCLYHCDLVLKHWTIGCDNETRNTVPVNVPGWRPLIAMLNPRNSATGLWQRFWFVLDEVVLGRSPDRAILDYRIRLKVKTETENNGGEPDPIAEAFTDHINQNFDKYANNEAFPELAELKLHGLATAIALWLAEEGRLDAATVFGYEPTRVATPETTPGIIVESPNVDIDRTANGTTTRKIMLFGGVDLAPKVSFHECSGPSLRSLAQSTRKAGKEAWEFCKDNARYIAAAIPLLRCPNVGRPPSLEIVNSSGKHESVLTRQERSRKPVQPVLVLHDGQGDVGVYRRVESQDTFGRSVFCRILNQTRTDAGINFQFDPQDAVYRTFWRKRYVRRYGSGQMLFNQKGELLKCIRPHSEEPRYA